MGLWARRDIESSKNIDSRQKVWETEEAAKTTDAFFSVSIARILETTTEALHIVCYSASNKAKCREGPALEERGTKTNVQKICTKSSIVRGEST